MSGTAATSPRGRATGYGASVVTRWKRLAQIELRDPGGNVIDLWRTFVSHGVASLPPNWVDEERRRFEVTLAVPGGRPRTVGVWRDGSGLGAVEVAGRAPGVAVASHLVETIGRMLRLDDDLSTFYSVAAADPALSWVVAGAGRMIRSPTVFEDVVKTVCTTNCSWSATERMVGALVEHLGERSFGPAGGSGVPAAFPTPPAMAEAGEPFYRDTARAGYRSGYLVSLARSVAAGELDLERLGRAGPEELSDDDLERSLLALPGVGPYAAAHIMMVLGRHSRLVLDSWTRPTYARLVGKRVVKDSTIVRRFQRYGRYAGLAFWLFITRDWVEEPQSHQADAFSATPGAIVALADGGARLP